MAGNGGIDENHARSGDVDGVHRGGEQAASLEFLRGVAGPGVVDSVVVAGDGDDRDRHFGEELVEHRPFLGASAIGDVTLHDQQLCTPRERLAHRGPGTAQRVGIAAVIPDSLDESEAGLAEMEIADGRHPTQRPSLEWVHGVDRRSGDGLPSDQHLDLVGGTGDEAGDVGGAERASGTELLFGVLGLHMNRSGGKPPPGQLGTGVLDREHLERARAGQGQNRNHR